jgi:hypothetical protein
LLLSVPQVNSYPRDHIPCRLRRTIRRMTKALIPLVLLALFVPLAAGQEAAETEPPNPLAGVRSVFINSMDMGVKREIRMVLSKELPQLKLAGKSKEADVILEIRDNLTPTRLDNRNREQIVFRGSGGGASGTTAQPTTAVRSDQPGGARMIVQGTFGVAVRGPVTLVVHKGVPSPFFARQFATELVKAYREANPEVTKP